MNCDNMPKKTKFKNEYILHRFTQRNLQKFFNLEFIASEKRFGEGIVDNLAFDKENKTLVIIEYKNKYNSNVLKQAEDYLEKINQIAEGKIIKHYDEYGNDIEPEEFEFDNIRVMIIGPKFTKCQIIDSPSNFEIWKVSKYDDCSVTYENMKDGNKIIALNIDSKEFRFTEEDTQKCCSTEENWDFYCAFKNKIMSKYKNKINLRFLVDGVSFRKDNQILCIIDLNIKSKIKIRYFSDPRKNIMKEKYEKYEITPLEKGGKIELTLYPKELGLTEEDTKNDKSIEEIDFAFELFEQVYKQLNEE